MRRTFYMYVTNWLGSTFKVENYVYVYAPAAGYYCVVIVMQIYIQHYRQTYVYGRRCMCVHTRLM